MAYIGDGYCDDVNNNEMCEFDGGDCCLEEVKTDFCTSCICYEGNNTNSNSSTINTITTTTKIATMSTTSIANSSITETAPTNGTVEQTTSETITLKSFNGSIRITNDIYTDSMGDSSSSEFIAKSATHRAMVKFTLNFKY